MNLNTIFTSPLEQFQVLPIFSFHFGPLRPSGGSKTHLEIVFWVKIRHRRSVRDPKGHIIYMILYAFVYDFIC